MTKFSANLGFLWPELSLPDAIRAAHAAGFEAVELHWPYTVPASEVKAVLDETGLPVLGLNTQRGDVRAGDNGLTALPDRRGEARMYIREACEYAAEIGAPNIHVMAGYTDGSAAAEECFVDNLKYACELADKNEQTILIEPLNDRDAPGYHLGNLDAALETIASVGAANLKVMFDCYHLEIMQGGLGLRLKAAMDHIGHIQIAAVPDRGEPDEGDLDYRALLAEIAALGWSGYIGAEYKPRNGTDAGLGWRETVLG